MLSLGLNWRLAFIDENSCWNPSLHSKMVVFSTKNYIVCMPGKRVSFCCRKQLIKFWCVRYPSWYKRINHWWTLSIQWAKFGDSFHITAMVCRRILPLVDIFQFMVIFLRISINFIISYGISEGSNECNSGKWFTILVLVTNMENNKT